MIIPTQITNYERTEAQLQEFLLFGIAVAGKNANQTTAALNAFLSGMLPGETPFQYIQRLEDRGWLLSVLKECKLSPYGTRYTGFVGAKTLFWNRSLSEATAEDLDSVTGVGPKTARFFLLHSRRDVRCAVLDTHILAWLRELGYTAPRSTPQSGAAYRRLEDIFLAEADKRGMSPADLDLQIWTQRSGN